MKSRASVRVAQVAARCGGGDDETVVEPKEIPNEPSRLMLPQQKSEFKTLKRDLTKEIERLRIMLKEMRSGETYIPAM